MVAIGGLKAKDLQEIQLAGADGLAQISALVRAENVEEATKEFVEFFEGIQKTDS